MTFWQILYKSSNNKKSILTISNIRYEDRESSHPITSNRCHLGCFLYIFNFARFLGNSVVERRLEVVFYDHLSVSEIDSWKWLEELPIRHTKQWKTQKKQNNQIKHKTKTTQILEDSFLSSQNYTPLWISQISVPDSCHWNWKWKKFQLNLIYRNFSFFVLNKFLHRKQNLRNLWISEKIAHFKKVTFLLFLWTALFHRNSSFLSERRNFCFAFLAQFFFSIHNQIKHKEDSLFFPANWIFSGEKRWGNSL